MLDRRASERDSEMCGRLLEAKKDPRHILLLCQTNVAVDGVLQCLPLGFYAKAKLKRSDA